MSTNQNFNANSCPLSYYTFAPTWNCVCRGCLEMNPSGVRTMGNTCPNALCGSTRDALFRIQAAGHLPMYCLKSPLTPLFKKLEESAKKGMKKVAQSTMSKSTKKYRPSPLKWELGIDGEDGRNRADSEDSSKSSSSRTSVETSSSNEHMETLFDFAAASGETCDQREPSNSNNPDDSMNDLFDFDAASSQ